MTQLRRLLIVAVLALALAFASTTAALIVFLGSQDTVCRAVKINNRTLLDILTFSQQQTRHYPLPRGIRRSDIEAYYDKSISRVRGAHCQ